MPTVDLGSINATGVGVLVAPHLKRSSTVVPANNNFANAQVILADQMVPGTLLGSTLESDDFVEFDAIYGAGEGAALRSITTGSVWYKFVSPFTGTTTLQADAFDGAPILGTVYTSSGSGTDTQENITANPTLPDLTTTPFEFSVTTGTVYYIMIAGASASIFTGSDENDIRYTISLSRPPMTVEMDATSRVTARLGQTYSVSVEADGKATLTTTAAVNSSYAVVTGRTTIAPDVLNTDANPNVVLYTGDPSAPPGGTVTTSPGTIPNVYRNVTGIAVIETIGAAGTDRKVVTNYVSLLGVDAHSPDSFNGYTIAPIPAEGSGTVYTYERWIRLRFQAPFNFMDGLRVWDLSDIADFMPGWSVKYGITSTYSTPVSTASSVATTALPTSDPGISSRNLMTSYPILGAVTDYYSDWLVIQASLDRSVANPGPILGFTGEGSTAYPLDLTFAWVES